MQLPTTGVRPRADLCRETGLPFPGISVRSFWIHLSVFYTMIWKGNATKSLQMSRLNALIQVYTSWVSELASNLLCRIYQQLAAEWLLHPSPLGMCGRDRKYAIKEGGSRAQVRRPVGKFNHFEITRRVC